MNRKIYVTPAIHVMMLNMNDTILTSSPQSLQVYHNEETEVEDVQLARGSCWED